MHTLSRRSPAFHADLRIFVPKMRTDLRGVPVDAGRAVSRMPERALPVAEMGPRKSETSARHRRRFDLQGVRVLHHRLQEPIVQGSGKEGSAGGVKSTASKETSKSPGAAQGKASQKRAAPESD